jgi:hypothetical protein
MKPEREDELMRTVPVGKGEGVCRVHGLVVVYGQPKPWWLKLFMATDRSHRRIMVANAIGWWW